MFTPEWNGMHPGAWRYGLAPRDGAMDFEVVRDLVQSAERAKFHAFFLADALGFRLEISLAALSRTAAAARFEPFTLMSALSTCTSQIGLVLTAHTTYDSPYHLARRFASLDHLSGGRAGWNIVTGGFAAGATHFGLETNISHAERYRRAEEVTDAVLSLWDSWEDDAFVRDQRSGTFFDPDKVHVARRQVDGLQVRGPLNIPRPIQGHPVLAQAGSSAAGREFAARFGELIFTLQPDFDAAREFYAGIKRQAVAAGREPDSLKVLPSLTLVLADTEAAAREKAAELDRLCDPRVGLELLSAFVDTDLSACALDGPLPEIPETTLGTRTIQRFFVERAMREQLTIRQLIPSALGFGAIATTPAAVVDLIERWIRADAADGFNVTFADLPESMDLFISKVIPELQHRDLFHRDYRGGTLRDNLGLPRPPNANLENAARRRPRDRPPPDGPSRVARFSEASTPMRF